VQETGVGACEVADESELGAAGKITSSQDYVSPGLYQMSNGRVLIHRGSRVGRDLLAPRRDRAMQPGRRTHRAETPPEARVSPHASRLTFVPLLVIRNRSGELVDLARPGRVHSRQSTSQAANTVSCTATVRTVTRSCANCGTSCGGRTPELHPRRRRTGIAQQSLSRKHRAGTRPRARLLTRHPRYRLTEIGRCSFRGPRGPRPGRRPWPSSGARPAARSAGSLAS